MRILFFSATTFGLWVVANIGFAASPPYLEDFESYALGDTAVTNFTEVDPPAWTIVSPSISGKGYQDAISISLASGAGGVNSSAAIDFPSLVSSSFLMSTLFRIDSLTVSGANAANTSTIGLFAHSTGSTPTASDRYQLSYYLDDDGAGHGTGQLWLHEVNGSFGDSLNELSSSTLPITPGDIYQMTLSGTVSGGSLLISATLTDTTTSSSISVSDTDAANLLTGSFFGYLNDVKLTGAGTVSLNADFDNFSMLVPEPGTATLLLFGWGIYLSTSLWRRKS